jgi:hypothetical protein
MYKASSSSMNLNRSSMLMRFLSTVVELRCSMEGFQLVYLPQERCLDSPCYLSSKTRPFQLSFCDFCISKACLQMALPVKNIIDVVIQGSSSHFH